MPDYVICARNIKGHKFGAEPAPSSYLFVPESDQPSPDHAHRSGEKWATRVLADARKGISKTEMGNILVFIHGYNNSQAVIMRRHRRPATICGRRFPGRRGELRLAERGPGLFTSGSR
jgi:hypothetical protein